MSSVLLDIRAEPANGWTPDHDRLLAALRAAGLERRDPQPGYMVATHAIEDADGAPLAVSTTRLPSIESP